MTAAAVVPGDELTESLPELLADERVAFLHVQFAGAGCFAFRVDRA
jgi:hypothetical protein